MMAGDVSGVSESQIRKGGGALGRLWILLGHGSHWQVLRIRETCCD